ncbi:APC family permease [Micromonospora mirobrigensis]|uniref:Amino acid/polyamine/organocation transporter, APC superfamily (TC 2.A.3) n=1 Tax=Micromonospora mirobrigensis TaxID=262898 RepID=A0A1C4WBF4_9ACTN|nr:APC family permease [Micromonospora mirobrigensis]SCE93271.1 amino acid/polyamine/organocation transporter, APC superfamily (TC 2.A.3) [Micromonospora mirobrigensis]
MAMTADARAVQADERGTTLKRAISGRLLYLFILGDVLGAGIYALVGEMAAEAGGMIWLPLAVALLLALLTAASYAELVTKYPKAGGAAVFAHRAYRSGLVSFVVGFCMLAAGLVSVAGLALAFAGEYLTSFLDVPAVPAALVFLAVVAALNLRGISESLGANVVMTVIELSGLLFIIALGALVLGRGDGDLGRVVQLPEGTSALPAVLGAALLAFYSFVGFETSANVAEETVNPTRNYPRALFGGLLTAGVVYVLVGLAVSAVVPTRQLTESSGPLLEVVRVADIGLPTWVFSLVALIAVANGALLTSIMTSRLTYGMATDGLLPRPLARVLPRRRSPWLAILVTTAASMALALTGDLETLANTVVLLLLVVFVSTNVAVLVLRRDRVDHEHFRTPVVLPVLALASCGVLLARQDGDVWLRGLMLIALGVALHLASAATRRAKARRGED